MPGLHIGWIMVARIAPEPVSSVASVADYRSRSTATEAAARVVLEPLPPILEPIPTPVPAPILAPREAFTTALLAEQLPVHAPSVNEVQLRTNTTWQAPDSALRLTDLQV